MSTLTLTVLRSPDHVPAQQRKVPGGELTIGRSPECDWCLPDPLKSLSRKHCTLEFLGGVWQVRDLSANGTFINALDSPVGREQVRQLRDGDRLLLGDYEIELRQEAAAFAPASPQSPGLGGSPFDDPPRPAFGAARLPGLDDPVEPLPGFGRSPMADAAVPDHTPASSDAFVPPPAVQAGKQLVPDNWWDDGAAAPAPPVAVPRPAPARQPVEAFAAPPSRDALSPFGNVEPTLLPVPPVQAPPPGVPRTVPPMVSPLVSPTVPPAARPTTGNDMLSALNALMSGSDLPPDMAARATADPALALQNAGALLRAAIAGIRRLLIARGSVKREFRIEQTMLRSRENNPLKFAASDEQALATLLDPRTNALQAVEESVSDLTVHQVATLAATQAAARALIEQMSPDSIESEVTGGSLIPGALDKRRWEAYKRRHAKLLAQFEDDFESAFGTAFARAYEQAVERVKG